MNKKNIAIRSLLFFLFFTLVCGLIYTLVMTAVGEGIFHHKATGSVIEINGVKYGSELIGQQFDDMDHLWGRPMSLDLNQLKADDGSPIAYAWATNKTPVGMEENDLVAERVERIKAAHPEMGDAVIPADLVTVSGSGLDPEISPEAAEYQVKRLAANTGKSEDEIRAIIDKYTTGRFLGVFGEKRVNVLKVNLALDGILVE